MKLKLFSALYFSFLALECFASLTGNLALQFVSKPSLMLILLVYFISETRRCNDLKHFIAAALVFAWIGDVLLLLDKIYKNLFILGLIAFLIAHLFYVFYFRQIGKLNRTGEYLKPTALIGVAIYFAIFYSYLFPHLGNLKIPVFIYGAIISLMLSASIHAFDSVRRGFGAICVAGAGLFVASDSLLSINRFVAEFTLAPVLIITAYAVGQFLLAEGSLRNLRVPGGDKG
jgi:uncharacterized membrane protein YhhN